MKAPEIIYRTTTYLDTDKGKTVWKSHPVAGAENVEYIRKDAFIEKACEWLNNFYSEDRHCYFVKEDIDNFKQAMEEQL